MKLETIRLIDIFKVILLSFCLILQPSFMDLAEAAGWQGIDQSECSVKLDQAEELYYEGDFEAAVALVQQCLRRNDLDKSHLIRAYTILSRIDLSQGKQISARENIRQILNLDPGYNPTIEQETPKYVKLVAEVRQEVPQSEDGRNITTSDSTSLGPWVWIGLGGAALTIIAILTSGKDTNQQEVESTNSLPEPPSFPENK